MITISNNRQYFNVEIPMKPVYIELAMVGLDRRFKWDKKLNFMDVGENLLTSILAIEIALANEFGIEATCTDPSSFKHSQVIAFMTPTNSSCIIVKRIPLLNQNKLVATIPKLALPISYSYTPQVNRYIYKCRLAANQSNIDYKILEPYEFVEYIPLHVSNYKLETDDAFEFSCILRYVYAAATDNYFTKDTFQVMTFAQMYEEIKTHLNPPLREYRYIRALKEAFQWYINAEADYSKLHRMAEDYRPTVFFTGLDSELGVAVTDGSFTGKNILGGVFTGLKQRLRSEFNWVT